MIGRLALAVAALCVTGCLMSEQSGQSVPGIGAEITGQPAYLGDVSFHFRSGLNYLLLFVRLCLFAGLGWLAVRAARAPDKRKLTIAVLVALTAGSGWLFGTAVRKVTSYRVSVTQTKLVVSIPSSVDVELSWDQISYVRVAGTMRATAAQRASVDRASADGLTEWSELELAVVGGGRYVLDLTELNRSQRTNLYRAIEHRSGLKEPEKSIGF